VLPRRAQIHNIPGGVLQAAAGLQATSAVRPLGVLLPEQPEATLLGHRLLPEELRIQPKRPLYLIRIQQCVSDFLLGRCPVLMSKSKMAHLGSVMAARMGDPTKRSARISSPAELTTCLFCQTAPLDAPAINKRAHSKTNELPKFMLDC
jgi:hypothetical protein